VSTIVQLAYTYEIDLNWILSYLQMENDFGSAGPGGRHFSMDHNNPWDNLCYPYDVPQCGRYPAENWGATHCKDPGNEYCYAVYPSMEIGLAAGYRQWQNYKSRGWDTWYKSLSVALCGNPGGCNSQWVDNVISTGRLNEQRWPYTGPEPTPQPVPITRVGLSGDTVLTLAGLAIMGGAIYLSRR